MLIAAKILAGLVLFIHVYIFLLETVLFESRGRKVFGLTKENAAIMKPAMSNQGCYNGFLAAALACGFLLPDAATGRARSSSTLFEPPAVRLPGRNVSTA